MTASLLRLAIPTALLLLAGHGDVRAADPPATPAATPATQATDPPTAPAEPKPAAGPTAAPAAAAGAKPAEARGPDGKPSPLHFEPTEKTRADFEVSFPSDI